MTGAQMIVQVLADEGVTRHLRLQRRRDPADLRRGVPLQRGRQARRRQPQMPLIVPANEQGAGFMAAGYARASGRVGVCLVTSGPGATNTVTPVRDCMADSMPIVVICGQVPTAAIGTDAFQEAPVPPHHGRGRQARLPGHRPDASSRPRCAPPSRSRAPAGPGPVVRRHAEGRAELGRRSSRARALLPIPGYRRAHARARRSAARAGERGARSSSMLGRAAAPADLRRRRRDQRQRRRGAARVRATRFEHSGRRRR